VANSVFHIAFKVQYTVGELVKRYLSGIRLLEINITPTLNQQKVLIKQQINRQSLY